MAMAAQMYRPVSQQNPSAYFSLFRGVADGNHGPEHLPRRPTNESIGSRSSHAGLWITPTGWDVSRLLDLSDTVRAALNKGKRPTPTALDDLTFVLSIMISGEMEDAPQSRGSTASQKVDLSVVERARLDKLLADITPKEEGADVSPKRKSAAPELWPSLEIARALEESWRARFKREYFVIDERRCDSLLAGPLRDVLFSSTVLDEVEIRSQELAGLSEVEGVTHFTPGRWWFNLECAYRDGIVGANSERLTRGRYGTAALPLLTGFEEDLPGGKTEYIRRGTQADMHFGLLTHLGRRTKILRGFRLKSAYAPQAGVRYDGLYNLASWSLKLCPCTNIYTLKVVLQRLPGQKPMREVLEVPKPSQLDDWALYEKLEEEAIKQREGAMKLTSWTTAREKERAEREHWRLTQDLQNEMRRSSETGGSDVPSSW
ncbi:hypothetical protein VPNG_04000 [Cytospora leucostoma]|uniref:YDG domain-containing protein n=1 Tax=Cytospora leucostoma TaxID=1230097 RepID=A0A423XE81_9PEZI|nr:hypothetical protein VPNG_04000 [Cytospora leucostoma]